ncbi:hypothetical protein RJ639_009215 [Escallonia herrerae]|uniref:GAG-pre-integrase domain-containing protein n=1 Tax=Escallonia herrerae TaxID=1293975 RepID=A0AA89AS29_9ASTE|nr:hypothetical protein RJ639_009215 [Escallonia herrerae]
MADVAGVVEDNSDGADVLSVIINSSNGGWILDTGAAATTASDIDSDTTKLWYMCLGHMSERGMDMLSKQGLLGSKKTRKLDFYEHCLFIQPKEFWAEAANIAAYLEIEEFIDAGKDHGVRVKVELEVQAPDSLPKMPADEEDGSHSIEENEESQEQ